MSDSSHLSIGEVLTLVQADFPDVTISKIRFLESQGLLDPERTPSGYRKFHGVDIERLQWILTQQRDHFLPLRVIRERLDEWDQTGVAPSGADVARPEPEPMLDEISVAAPTDAQARRHAAASLAAGSAIEVMPATAASPVPSSVVPRPTPSEDPMSTSNPGSSSVVPESSGTQMTAQELADRAGVSVEAIAELESYSMIESKRVGAETYFDVNAVPVASACAAFLAQGVEVRHLRMYKIAAEREAGMIEQLIMPMLKQRNPEARNRAVTIAESLSAAGESMHAALLRQALRQTLP